MWPFTRKEPEKPDTRPPSAAAKAIAESLRNEPQRWKIGGHINQLIHDSLILVETDGWIRQPNLEDEPESNAALVQAAIEDWIAKRVMLPIPSAKEVEAKVESGEGK